MQLDENGVLLIQKDRSSRPFITQQMSEIKFQISEIKSSKEMNFFVVKPNKESIPNLYIGCLTKTLLDSWLNAFKTLVETSTTYKVDDSDAPFEISTTQDLSNTLRSTVTFNDHKPKHQVRSNVILNKYVAASKSSKSAKVLILHISQVLSGIKYYYAS